MSKSTSTVRHPAFPHIVREVEDVRSWLAAGWQRVTGTDHPDQPDQPDHPDQQAAEPTSGAPCPTCGASGDEPCVTASGEQAKKPHAARA